MKRPGLILLLLGGGLVLAGALRGEPLWVLSYVRLLCLSCMGLGS